MNRLITSLVQLASDMASFNNTSVDDALLALRSGLSGETEPLKRFGIALSEVRLKEDNGYTEDRNGYHNGLFVAVLQK